MVVLFIAALVSAYILYVLWYSIVHEYLDAVVLIALLLALIAVGIWCQGVMVYNA